MRTIVVWSILASLADTGTVAPARQAAEPSPRSVAARLPGCCQARLEPASQAEEREAIEAAAPKPPIAAKPDDGRYRVRLPPRFVRATAGHPVFAFEKPPHKPRAIYLAESVEDDATIVEVDVQTLAVNRAHEWSASALASWAAALLRKWEPVVEYFVVASKEPGAYLAEAKATTVYLSLWSDGALAHFEYAVVLKGCERVERYMRFVEGPKSLRIVSMTIDGTLPPPQAATYLNAFFDEPFGTSAASERKFAFGRPSRL